MRRFHHHLFPTLPYCLSQTYASVQWLCAVLQCTVLRTRWVVTAAYTAIDTQYMRVCITMLALHQAVAVPVTPLMVLWLKAQHTLVHSWWRLQWHHHHWRKQWRKHLKYVRTKLLHSSPFSYVIQALLAALASGSMPSETKNLKLLQRV
jgi:hypothetical protein